MNNNIVPGEWIGKIILLVTEAELKSKGGMDEERRHDPATQDPMNIP